MPVTNMPVTNPDLVIGNKTTVEWLSYRDEKFYLGGKQIPPEIAEDLDKENILWNKPIGVILKITDYISDFLNKLWIWKTSPEEDDDE